MSVKHYDKNTSYFPEGNPSEDGCIPAVPDFIDQYAKKLRIVTSVNGKTGDVFLDIGDSTYIHHQSVASIVWVITHNLDRYPSVTVVDSAGSVVIGDVQYMSRDQIVLTFQGAFSGTAYLN